MHSLSLAVVTGDQALVQEIRDVIADGSARIDLLYKDPAQLPELLGRIPRVHCDCVVLESVMQADLAGVVEEIKAVAPEIAVVVMRRSKSPEDILEAVRAGADEYMYPPVAADLRKFLMRQSARVENEGKLVGLLGAKGGCGCTTLAMNLAAALARVRKHVLLLDADLTHGSVEFLANVACDYTLADAAANLHRMDPDFWKRLVARRDGMDLLAAPRNCRERNGLTGEQVRSVIAFAVRQYDFVLCDFGSGPTPGVAPSLPDCNNLFLVSTTDVPAIYQSRQVMQMAPELGLDATRVRVALNRVPKDLPVTLEDLAKIIGRPVALALPEAAAEVRESHADRKLLAGSPLRQRIDTWARSLAGIEDEQARPRKRFLPAALAALKPTEA